jgi:serine/threonine-protein kinase HipA
VSRSCRICLEETEGDGGYHTRCLRKLFHSSKVPQLDIEVNKLHIAALAMVGHASLSGVQKKISVDLAPGRATLRVAAEGGRYILKPQTGTFPYVPENEHVTTRMAELVGIEVASNGLVSLNDGSLAYVGRRFDRLPNGHKLRQEDFCQLDRKSPKQKYDGSCELCVRLVRNYATEPLVEVLKLFRLLLFSWWSGNGDMHLKNFSLMVDTQGIVRFTPAYDLLCTRLVIPNDTLALPVDGRRDKLTRASWLELGEYCQLPAKAVARILDKQIDVLDDACRLIVRSFLPDEQKDQYQKLVTERTAVLKSV